MKTNSLVLNTSPSFRNSIKEGDTVTRMLAGLIPMELKVTEITEDRIICGPWEFDRDLGVEIDKDIPMTVSFLILDKDQK